MSLTFDLAITLKTIRIVAGGFAVTLSCKGGERK
jgi:hypothetical protein